VHTNAQVNAFIPGTLNNGGYGSRRTLHVRLIIQGAATRSRSVPDDGPFRVGGRAPAKITYELREEMSSFKTASLLTEINLTSKQLLENFAVFKTSKATIIEIDK
jgi:hypothetical protein